MKPNLQRPEPTEPPEVDVRVLKAALCLIEERIEQESPWIPFALLRAASNISEAIDMALKQQARPWTRAYL